MAYVKIDWTEETAITHTRLNTMETQYDEFKTDYDAHDHDSRYFTEAESDARFFDAGTDGPGTLLDADTVDGYDTDGIEDAAVPRGNIGIWSGSVVSIPSGWVICDGTNSTPNLQDRFVVGAGGAYGKGDTGGYASRTPTGTVTIVGHALSAAELPEHSHQYNDYYSYVSTRTSASVGRRASDAFTDTLRNTGNPVGADGNAHGHAGSTIAFNAYDNRPPYYALCWIMRELA